MCSLQLTQAKPVDDSKIQNAVSVRKSDDELKLICPKDAGCLVHVEPVETQKTKIWLNPDRQKEESFSVELQSPAAVLADLAVSAMPKMIRSADLAYQTEKKASTISEGNSQAKIVIKRQNHLHF